MTNVANQTSKAAPKNEADAQARADLAKQKIDARFSGLPLPQRIDALTRKIRWRQKILDGWNTDFNQGHGGNTAAKQELRLQIEAEQVELRNQLQEAKRAE